MDENEKSKALNFLQSKWVGSRECAICKKSDWSIHPNLYELRSFNDGDFVVGGPLVPLIGMECKNCGHVLLLSALRAGLVTPEEGKDG